MKKGFEIEDELKSKREELKSYSEFAVSATPFVPKYVHYNKKTGYARVEFYDGKTMEVRPAKRARKSLEEAVVWAVSKKVFGTLGMLEKCTGYAVENEKRRRKLKTNYEKEMALKVHNALYDLMRQCGLATQEPEPSGSSGKKEEAK
ncbi:MAG: hypothetical protein LKG11_00835 [Bacilli bacterium]|nr:hypothetical protein [Bacilli bacterium]